MSSSDEPQLGAACESAGALACAGAHQKLTLVCTAGGKWEANQTCASGQFCSSTPGPDLGICKAPEADCGERQPGETFCAGDQATLMQCDVDGLAATEVEKCATGCLEGKCAGAHPCPDNVVYSCDSGCPGPSAGPSCFNLCPTPAGGVSPLLQLPDEVNGIKYAVALPVVAANSQPCSCAQASGAVQGVAFRVPSPPLGHRWRITYPNAWEIHDDANPSGETTDYYKACKLTWPRHLSGTPGCTTIGPQDTPPQIWLSASSPVAAPGTVLVELVANANAKCAQ